MKDADILYTDHAFCGKCMETYTGLSVSTEFSVEAGRTENRSQKRYRLR